MDAVATQQSAIPTQLLENTVLNLYGKLLADNRTRSLLRNVRKERYCWQQVVWLEHRLPANTGYSTQIIRQAYQHLLACMKIQPETSTVFMEHLNTSLQETCEDEKIH